MFRRPWVVGAALLALPAAIFFAAACGDDAEGDSASASEVLTALNFTGNAGLHDIDESINEGGEIPADARTVALRAETVMRVTAWPSALEEEAEALADVFAEMAATLDGESPDPAAAGEAAARAHDAEHEFSGNAWAYLQEEAGIEAPGEDDHGG